VVREWPRSWATWAGGPSLRALGLLQDPTLRAQGTGDRGQGHRERELGTAGVSGQTWVAMASDPGGDGQ
jgi:hypothetical protein